MKKIFRILLILIAFLNNAKAQNNNSLFGNDFGNDYIKATIYYLDLSDSIISYNTDTAIFYSKKANQYAKKSNLDSLKMKAYFSMAYNYYLSGKYDMSLKYFDSTIYVAKAIDNYKYLIDSYSLVGAVNVIMDRNNIGITFFDKSLKIAEEFGDSANIARAYANIGRSYLSISQKRHEAKHFLNKALKIYLAINAKEEELINIYADLSDVTENYEKKIEYSNKALNIAEKEGNLLLLAELYFNKALIFFEAENYKEADIWLKKSLETSIKTDFTPNINLALLQLATNSILLNDFNKAEYYLNKFDEKFDYKQNTIYNQKWYLKTASDISVYKKDYKKAYEYMLEYGYLSDSLEVKMINEQFVKYIKLFELKEKDKQIAQQQLKITQETTKRNKLIFIGIIIFLIAIGIFQWFFTKQKQRKKFAEHELKKEKEINELRTTFLENIAHEIRTPITLINGYLKLGLDNINNKEKLERNINTALSNSNKVLSNANEILELLKSEKGKLPIINSYFKINDFIKNIVFSFSSLVELKKINLKYNTNIASDIIIESDKNRIEKILNNFISNAIKFSPSNSEIIVNAKIDQNKITIKVTDFGEGIEDNEQEKIFQRFYQTPNSSKIGGVGIGLSLAKDFAESLNGNIGVNSKLGEGATFFVELPIKITSKTNTEKESLILLNNIIPNEKESILIVEDNPEMNAFIHELLSPYFQCDVAFTGTEGLEKIKSKKYKLIVSDIMMPEMSGTELKQEINKHIEFKTIPFIFLTAKVQISDKIEAYNLGIDDYIIKPFSKDELIVRINNLLKNKKEREKLIKEKLEFIEDNKSAKEEILEKAYRIIEKNIANNNFKVSDLALEIAYSQRQLSRLLKKLTGLSPNQFITEVRLQKAYKYIINKKYMTLSEVRFNIGMPSTSNFNKKFTERFGIKPSDLNKD